MTVDPVEQPGTTFDIITSIGIEPGDIQTVPRPEIDGLDTAQNIHPTMLMPSLNVDFADAAVVGISQVQTAVTAAAAGKS